jgi:hypothetical protein
MLSRIERDFPEDVWRYLHQMVMTEHFLAPVVGHALIAAAMQELVLNGCRCFRIAKVAKAAKQVI